MTNGTGLILSAPSSGSGKTTLTLGVLRALRRRGLSVRSAKSGPDYIDPRFHEAASGAPCLNLDAWAMTPERLRDLAQGPQTLLIEGAMGLFDGAPPAGKGASADLARHLGLPVVLILDTAKQSQSVAAVVQGFANHRADVRVVGVIFNNTGSARHEAMLTGALAGIGLPVLGAVRRQSGLEHPSRHLGLVQASERPDLEDYLERVADIVETCLDLEALLALASPLPAAAHTPAMPPPAQRIAIARDQAFAFAYPHLLADWRKAGAEIAVFSPLADQAPPDCDLVFLPGGYPELHAAQLAANGRFLRGLRQMAKSTAIYGECGGYMVLGEGLIDAEGHRHEMAGLLRLETSFAKRKLHLGYRQLSALAGPFSGSLTAHEFHYASTISSTGAPLFKAKNAEGDHLPDMGLTDGRVSGSFAHVIDAG
jgi:cobyrinic acid a,c-diamide synthase